jgi:uncharacterized coiled-coil protein SlyX
MGRARSQGGPNHRITELETTSGDHRKRITELENKSAECQARTDRNLAEITDKLNGLIGYVQGYGSSKQ